MSSSCRNLSAVHPSLSNVGVSSIMPHSGTKPSFKRPETWISWNRSRKRYRSSSVSSWSTAQYDFFNRARISVIKQTAATESPSARRCAETIKLSRASIFLMICGIVFASIEVQPPRKGSRLKREFTLFEKSKSIFNPPQVISQGL